MTNDKVFKVDRNVLAFAMRYALGRMTYAPTIVMENIKYNIDLYNINELELLIRDINDHIGSYGMECDEIDWMNFKRYLEDRVVELEKNN